jgi:hypothetical protein
MSRWKRYASLAERSHRCELTGVHQCSKRVIHNLLDGGVLMSRIMQLFMYAIHKVMKIFTLQLIKNFTRESTI